MAVSNRDRVGKAFEMLGVALDSFITQTLEPDLQVKDWTMLLAAVDAGKSMSKTYSPTDPQSGLRMLTENIPHRVKPGWYPFRTVLSRSQESLASELRDTRNDWAHNAPFSTDDAYRALDTAERLLRAIGAIGPADEAKRLRVDLRQVTTSQEERKAGRVTAATDIGSVGLPAWREVLQPHHDVASGNFHAAEFAADLSMVMRGEGDPEYTDPVEFFRRTFLTGGLRELISRAARRLSGDLNAPPVINLQTNFGGGKTHSMLSLWHLASGRRITEYPQDLQDVAEVTALDALSGVRRVALVGNHIPAGSVMRKPDGTIVRTLWGELAWQLGGAEGYAILAASDQQGTNPGDHLRELLTTHAPALILIDEWVAYARQLYGREGLPGGTFDTQFTFAQTLTEVAKAVAGVLVVISIPASSETSEGDSSASDEEVGGENGKEALRRLQNIVRRVAEPWRPANAEESFEIVRRRLFETPTGEQLSRITGVATAMVKYYQQHSTEFPSAASDLRYADRIKRSYPVHPELFDRLYEDWSTLDRFQRTRGVLRLMNTVVGTLWRSEDASPLIMPGSVPLEADSVVSELAQYLDDRWKAVIDADVAGPTSAPAQVDNENPFLGQRSTTRRLARAVFMGATPTLNTAHRGVTKKDVFLGTALPGDVPGNFHSALNHLGNTATYFYTDNDRCWYDTQANTTRSAQDYAAQRQPEEVWAEVVRRLQPHRTSNPQGFVGVHIAPESSADVPDQPEVRLVVVPPRFGYDRRSKNESPAVVWATDVLDHRGSSPRLHRNCLVFLAIDEGRGRELDSAIREFLAWQYIADNQKTLNLTDQQKTQAGQRATTADRTATDRLLGSYHWALIPEQPDPAGLWSMDAVKAEGSEPNLIDRTARKLVSDSALTLRRSASLFRLDLDGRLASAWEAGHISVGQLWSYYTRYPYLARLRDRSVLETGIASVTSELLWHQTGFAVAEAYVGDTYLGLVLPNDDRPLPTLSDTALLVKPARAEAQRAHDVVPEPVEGGGRQPGGQESVGSNPTTDRSPRSAVPIQPLSRTRPRRYFGSRVLDPQFYVRDFNRLSTEVLQHLAAEGAELEVRIEITATTRDGFDEARVRTISENATVLKFEQSGFEAE